MPRALRNGRARIATVTAPVSCAAYCRVSTEDQANKEYSSLEVQREACESYVRLHRDEGWVLLPDSYSDGGFSGGNTNRPALQRLLDDIRFGKVHCVAVQRFDRLSRSMLDFLQLLDFFKRHGVSFVSVSQRFDTSTPVGEMTLNILLSFAQFERQIIAERTRDKIGAARRKGKFTGGHPVLGFDLDPKGGRLRVNEPETRMVSEIFELFLEKRSLVAVADELNRRSWTLKRWTTKSGKLYGGGRFDKCSLRRLLTNHAYIGKVMFEGVSYDGEHRAIVSPDVFRNVQRILGDNRSNGGAAQRNRHGALLRGILRCSACDAPMSFAPTRKAGKLYRYYRCSAAMKRGQSTCPTGCLSADRVETFVVDQIRRIGASQELQRETFRQVAAQVAAERRGLKAETRRFHKGIAASQTTVEKLVHELPQVKGEAKRAVAEQLEKEQGRVRELEARLAEVRTQLDALKTQDIEEADVARALQDFEEIWSVLLTAEKERVLRLLIDEVSYDANSGKLNIHYSPTGFATMAAEMDAEEPS